MVNRLIADRPEDVVEERDHLRRTQERARRRGYRVIHSPRPVATDRGGGFVLVNACGDVVFGCGRKKGHTSQSLDAIDQWLLLNW